MPNVFPGHSVTRSSGLPSLPRNCATRLFDSAPETIGYATRPQWADLMLVFFGFSSAAVVGLPSSARAAPRTRKAEESERLAGAVTGLAGLAALAIALAFPAAYFLSANNRLLGVIEVRAQIYGDQVTDAASQNPE